MGSFLFLYAEGAIESKRELTRTVPLILYGTKESGKLVEMLKAAGYEVVAIASTDYGVALAAGLGAQVVSLTALEHEEFAACLKRYRITAVIDATHPNSSGLSKLARETSSELGLSYFRYRRVDLDPPHHPLIHPVYSWEEAARRAADLGGVVFLTTGSNNLELFIRELKGKQLVVRVLPESDVVKKCQDLGISPKNIVALHGPFSTKFNKSIFQAYKAGVVVTRDSGKVGGTDTKVAAALALGIPVVLIKQPREKYAFTNCEEIVRALTTL